MGGVPTKHHTRSKTGKRRSHMALKPSNLIPCSKCKFPTISHRACPECGFYKEKKKEK